MLLIPDIRLAAPRDARPIAELSRDTIEHGLAWSWTPPRVLRAIRDPAINVVVAQWRDEIAGFGIMQYADDSAHLALLAVHPVQRQPRRDHADGHEDSPRAREPDRGDPERRAEDTMEEAARQAA